MPLHGDDFLAGRISIGDVGRENQEWIESSERRGEATFQAVAITFFGIFVGAVGASLLLTSSRRLREVAYADREFTAEAIGRGLQRGLGNDVEARLEKLAKLHERGLVTEAEYAAKRQPILADV